MGEITNIPATSYDLSNRVRDLSDEFSTVLKTSKGLLALIGEIDRTYLGDGGKLEWLEDVEDFQNDILNNAGAVAAADTSFIVTTPARFQTGMLIKFRDYDETMTVTHVNTATSTLTVTRSTNGLTPPVSVTDGATIDILARPVAELSRANEQRLYQLDTEYNYYQTFREDIPFSERIANSKQYGHPTGQDFINYNIGRYMRTMRSQLNRIAIWGERSVGSATSAPTMRGVYTWLQQADTNKTDASGAAITATNVNNLMESIYLDDTNIDNIVLFMDTVQARNMATFNATLANRMETVAFDEQMASGATSVTMFLGDLQAVGPRTIVVDKDAPKGTIMAIDTSKIKLVYGPGGRLVEWDSKPPDAPPDAQRRGLIMTASLMMKDHKYSHGLIYNAKKTL